MRGRTKVAIVLALAGLIAGVTPVLASSSGQASKPITGYTGKIENRVLSDTAGGREASIVINLAQQADLSAASGMRDQDAQGWYVYRALKRTADRTQAPIKALLKAQGVSYKSFWAANMIVAQADHGLVQSLAARPDVKSIESNAASNWLESDQSAIAESSFDSVSILEASAPEAIEPGVNQVKAPNVWSLGFNGTGIVVADQDTGIRWTHNALRPHYRGWNGLGRRPQLQLVGRHPLRRRHPAARTARCPATTTATAPTRRAPPSVTTASRPEPDRRRARREVDRLPQHGPGQRHAGDVHRVLPVLHGADEPRRARTRIRRSGPT